MVSTAPSATCRGGGPASRRGRSWSASSCCSRPPSPGSSRSGATGSPGGRHRRPPQRRVRPTCCAPGGSSATRAAPSGCTSARRRSPTEHGDVVPDDVDALLALPGVGTYTARAVACFAYGKRVPVVDTNVRRVVARAVHGRADSPASVRDLADVDALMPNDERAPRFSVALMELGAIVCTARSPRCGLCPLSTCAWRSAGYPPSAEPARRVQRYAGTDRQVRGRLLDVLRANDAPVERAQLDVAWSSDPAQRDRALGLAPDRRSRRADPRRPVRAQRRRR